MVNYFVKNENTLGYVYDEQPKLFGVLASKPQYGGDDWMNSPVMITPGDVMRKATIADFDYFRVSHVGHIQ